MNLNGYFVSRGTTFLLAAALLAGCGGDDSTGPTPENESAATTATAAAALLLDTVLPSTSTSVAALPATPVGYPAPTADGGLTCPAARVTRGAGNSLVVELDYGDGCASQFTGETHAGRVAIAFGATGYSLTCTDYTARGYALAGTVTGTLEGSAVTIDTDDFTLAASGGSWSVSAQLTATWQNAGTPTDPADDTWSVAGAASVTPSGSATSQVAITVPLLCQAACAWPVSGTLTVQTGDSPLVTTVDFGTGACDDLVVVTVAGRSKTIHLSTGKEA